MQNFTSSCALVVGTLLALSMVTGCGDSGTDTTGSGGGTTSGNGGAGGGSGGAGGGVVPGEPIDAPDDTWTWVDFPDAMCMNGEATGIGINPTGNHDKVLFFLQGGNACFNAVSCGVTANTDGYTKAKFDADDSINSQAFDRSNPDNPFKDYSYVYVPYCTGDVHAGDASDVKIGSKTWQFHGYGNISAYLNRLVPTFPTASKVMVTGVSAGGFGAAFNFEHVATAFPTAQTFLVDDSGPPMGEEFVPACLQQHFVETWGLDKTLCSDCLQSDGVFMEPFVKHIIQKYPNENLGLISSTGDGTIRNFWGYGEMNCSQLNGLPPPYDAAKYQQGLEDLRDRIAVGSSFHLFMIDSMEHVWLDNDPTTVVVDGVTLQDWLIQLEGKDSAWGNVPSN